MDHSTFPPYTDIVYEDADGIETGRIVAVNEGDLVVLESGKTFIYQITTPGIPGRYKAYSDRIDTSAGGLVFDKIDPIQVNERDVETQDPDDPGATVTNTEIEYSIKINSLEEIN